MTPKGRRKWVRSIGGSDRLPKSSGVDPDLVPVRDEGVVEMDDRKGPDVGQVGSAGSSDRSTNSPEAETAPGDGDGQNKAGAVGDPPAAEQMGPQDKKLAEANEMVRTGHVKEALAAYRGILREDPVHVKARNNLGILLDEMGNHAAALDHLQVARQADPDNIEVIINLGAALGALGRFEEAERELRRAQRIAPEDVSIRSNLGILFFRRGLYEESESELQWVCDHQPEDAMAHYYRGEALNRLGRVDAALEALEKAASLEPQNAKAFYTMGILYDKKGLPDQAEAMYRRSRELARV